MVDAFTDAKNVTGRFPWRQKISVLLCACLRELGVRNNNSYVTLVANSPRRCMWRSVGANGEAFLAMNSNWQYTLYWVGLMMKTIRKHFHLS